MDYNDNQIVLYNKDMAPVFTFSPFKVSGENVDFSVDVSISWYHVLVCKSISFKRIYCIMKILEELYELKRNEVTVKFPDCSLYIVMSETGSLSWKIELQDKQLQACFYFNSDVTFIPDILSQIRSCEPDTLETDLSDEGVDLYFNAASTAVAPFYSFDSLNVDMKMLSDTVSVVRRASVFLQDWQDFCTGVEMLLNRKRPFTFSPLGDFMFIRMYDNNGTVYLDCDISDFCCPSNQLIFTRKVNNFEEFAGICLGDRNK